MSKFMIVIVLVNGLLSIGEAQKATKCSDLPKIQFPNVVAFLYSGPYIYDYSIRLCYDCVAGAFIRPLLGQKYDGSITTYEGNGATTTDYTLSADKMTLTTMNNCGDENGQSWYLANVAFFPYGSFYCIYTCDSDGVGLLDFSCATNNKTAFLSQEEQTLSLANDVPNYDQIHPISDSCFQQ
ncbi:hypothetical protein CHUAL_006364 [Chamberlinius hualienensis]